VPIIYFIRHGETDWNRAGRIQGHTDIPINATGRAQAARNGGVLAEAIDAPEDFQFVASPLTRTRETMAIVRAQLGLPAEGYATDERLREVHFGAWEGWTWDDLKQQHRPAVKARKADVFNFTPPEGESYASLSARALAWLGEIDRDTVVVSHGGVMRCLRGHVAGEDRHAIPLLECPQDRVMVIENGRIGWL
jgi:probable phosphoglycerate mutase